MLPVTSAGNIILPSRWQTRAPGKKPFRPAVALRHEGLHGYAGQNLPSAEAESNTKPVSLALTLMQRRRRHFLGLAVMQSQHAVTAAGKLKVVGDDKGSKPVFAMKSLH